MGAVKRSLIAFACEKSRKQRYDCIKQKKGENIPLVERRKEQAGSKKLGWVVEWLLGGGGDDSRFITLERTPKELLPRSENVGVLRQGVTENEKR